MRSDQVTQGLIQSGIEILQGWRLHSLSEEPVPVMDCEEVSPYIQLQMTKWPFQPQKLFFSCSGSFLILIPNFHSGILTYQTPALIQLLLVSLIPFLTFPNLDFSSSLHHPLHLKHLVICLKTFLGFFALILSSIYSLNSLRPKNAC